MPSPSTLRPETDADVPFLAALYASTRVEELQHVPWPQPQKDAFLREQFGFQRQHYLQHYADAQFDVIELDGVPAGRLYVHRGPQEIRIVDIALLPEYRGHGLGAALLGNLLVEGKQNSRPVSIHVERTNRALHLYQRLGFQIAGEQGPVYLYMVALP